MKSILGQLRSSIFIINFEYIPHCFGFCIVDFEQLNAGCECGKQFVFHNFIRSCVKFVGGTYSKPRMHMRILGLNNGQKYGLKGP